MDAQAHPDSKLIADLGGAAKVAELLGLDKAKGGVQRVHNWIARGIPAAVKVSRPDLFMRSLDVPEPMPDRRHPADLPVTLAMSGHEVAAAPAEGAKVDA